MFTTSLVTVFSSTGFDTTAGAGATATGAGATVGVTGAVTAGVATD